MRKLSLCLFAFSLGFASLTQAQPTVTKATFKGNTAHAAAASGDNGCFSAFFGVTASDEVTKGDAGTTTTKTVEIGYGGRDLCEHLSFGGRQDKPLTFNIANQTMTFDFDFLVNYANTETDERFTRRVTGTVTITPNGDVERSRRNEIVQNQELRTVTRSKGTTRDATVTVNVSIDGVPQSLPIISGEVGSVSKGTIETTRY